MRRLLRTIDYGDLRFLNVACLVSIAFIYTAFRAGQFMMDRDEVRLVGVVQELTAQRDLVAEYERLIAYAQNRASRPNAEILGQLSGTYRELQRRRLDGRFFNGAAKKLERDLANPRLKPGERGQLLQTLLEEDVRYRQLLSAELAAAFTTLRGKSRTSMAFEIFTYFILIGLLLAQAGYVFRPAIRRLNASLAVRSDFLSRISHEIRNPMNSIIGMADILKSTRLNHEQRQYIENLLRSGHALLDMLNNLIDFSVVEGGRLTLNPGPFDLFRSLDRDINLIAIAAHHKNLNVYVDTDPALPNRLTGDSGRLDQVLVNLLNNAVKFTEHGHVRLGITVESRNEASVRLRFSVADTGIGIRKEQREEVFESFVQADSSIQRKYGGSGLGLSISREIVRLMGGRLELVSEIGNGSCFYFTLEFGLQPARETVAATPLMQLAGRRMTFLTALGEGPEYRRQMSRLHCRADIIHSARDVASRDEGDLLIDDSAGIIAMINCRNIAAGQNPGSRAVALVRSNCTKENLDLLRRNGFTRFLIKPLKPWELIELPAAGGEQEPAHVPANKSLAEQLRERDLKILLVDDSNDNLFLLKELVSPVAGAIHFAENGLEACEKFRATKYDVVFMDIQMPVMDGYTAIRKMREHQNGRGVPIFAVTAHSGLVDAQKCVEAGFTDRIVKPVVRSDIYGSLARAFGLNGGEMDSGSPSGIPQKFMDRLMPTYFRTRDDDLGRLHSALQGEDFASLKGLGHKIKGSAASYGFNETSALSLGLETAAEAGDLPACRDWVERIERAVASDRARCLPTSPDASV